MAYYFQMEYEVPLEDKSMCVCLCLNFKFSQ